MTFVSHAQNFEDVVLWRALSDVEHGCYIDIGAHDPHVDSVSLSFYRAGWRGMHVEPLPNYAARLREARPDEPVVEAAVTDASGPMLFYELDGLSSGSEQIAEHHIREGLEPRRMLVPTVRLDRLLTVMGPEIHWLKIDVEGMEADVLRSWGDCEVRPWVLAIEATFPNSNRTAHHQWLDQVLERNYKQVLFDGLILYFVHESHSELAPRLAAPANVFDAFSITSRHFSAREISAEIDDLRQRFEAERECVASLELELEQTRESERKRASEFNALLKEQGAGERRLREATNAAEVARIELATLRERTAQLQDKLDRADHSYRQSEARLMHSEQQLTDARTSAAQLTAQIEQLRSALHAATAVMKRVIEEPEGIWLRIGRWLRVAQTPARWRELERFVRSGEVSLQSTVNWIPPQPEDVEPTMKSIAYPHARNPYLRAKSLAELLTWDDVEFVRCAYVTILGRQPDRSGEAYYTARVRAGCSKMQVLWQLRHSEEGDRHDPGIAGLDRALRQARRSRMLFVGRLFRLFNHDEGDSAQDRRARATANEIALLRAAQGIVLAEVRGVASDVRILQNLMQAADGSTKAAGSASAQIGSASSSMRGLLDPLELDSARSPEEVIGSLKAAINKSREIMVFRSRGPSLQ